MTQSNEWRELLEDWRIIEEKRAIAHVRAGITQDTNDSVARSIAVACGSISTLESFDRYIQRRIESERGGNSRPLPTGVSNALRNLRKR
jgi:hypothetical protein